MAAVRGLAACLRVGEFRALLISYAVNRAGDAIGALALALVVYQRTHSALATAGLFGATQFAPGLAGPLLAARIDAQALGRVLPRLFALEALLFCVLAALAAHGPVWLVCLLAFGDGVLAFAARALTRAGAASTLIAHDLVAEGKAAFNFALAAATIAGPALGAAVVAVSTPATALLLDAASFAAAAVLLATASGLRAPPESTRVESLTARLAGGLRYVWSDRELRALVFGEGAAFVFLYLVVPVTVVYAERTLGAGAGGYGAILASWGAGIAVGSLLQIKLARRVGAPMILAATVAVAVAYIGTAIAPTLLAACAVSVIGGIGNGMQWASVETRIHQVVEEAFRVRVAATLEALASIAPGIGLLSGGALTAAWSPRGAYWVAGVGLLVLTAAASLSVGRATVRRRAAPDAATG